MKKTITRFLVWLAAFVVMDVITMSSAGLAAKFYNAGDYMRFGSWATTTLLCAVHFVRLILISGPNNDREVDSGEGHD